MRETFSCTDCHLVEATVLVPGMQAVRPTSRAVPRGWAIVQLLREPGRASGRVYVIRDSQSWPLVWAEPEFLRYSG